MAKARMLHKKISLSMQVNELPLPARLLFTWLIPHADDEGRLKGDPKYVKGSIVPLTNWPPKMIRNYLELMNNNQLIHYWQENNEWFIQFCKWEDYQTIRKDRLEPSKLPSFNNGNDNQLSTKRQPSDNQQTAQANISKPNVIEVNKSEYKENVADKNLITNEIASPITTKDNKKQQFDENQQIVTKDNKNTQNDKKRQIVTNRDKTQTNKNQQKPTNPEPYKGNEYPEDPNQYRLKSGSEYGAKIAWQKLEPNNPRAFYTTYLSAANKGLPPGLFWQFASEIKQSNAINPGAVFNSKVKSYFEKKGNTE